MTTRTLIPAQLRGPICPAVTRSAEVISSSGAIFSCTEHPLVPEHEQGDVLELVEHADHDRQRPAGRYDDWHDGSTAASRAATAACSCRCAAAAARNTGARAIRPAPATSSTSSSGSTWSPPAPA